MNGMVHFESQIRYNVIFSSDHALFLPFNPRFCVIYLLIMQNRSTQILYQYLGTKVCLHSYNDTVNVNAEVIIEHCFSRFSSFEGVQILDSVYLRSSQNSQPNSDTSDVNSRKERGRVFRIARSDPPPAF